MKAKSVYFPLMFLLLILLAPACKKEDVTDPTKPNGDFTVSKSGSFVNENGSGSGGTAELGTDEDGTQFLHFASNFTTNLATGTVVVYLSTSDTYTADPGSGNPDLRLVGYIDAAGEHYFRLDPAAESKFTHVILYCASAGVQFGNAAFN